MNKLEILLVDDDDQFAADLMLLGKKNFVMQRAASGEEALTMLDTFTPDAVLLDLQLGAGMDGLQALTAVKKLLPDLPVIMITEYAGYETAVQAMKLGALHYAAKHPNMDALQAMIERELEHIRWKKLYQHKTTDGDGMIGSSAPMRELKKQIAQVAAGDAYVVIQGESGTGKELVAKAIHRQSSRADKPLITVNSGAIAPSLMESELFGHEKGAFTGAACRRKGYFELAHGGTLFFDEIADLDISLQGKLLRVLQNKSFMRVGGQKEIHVDVRVIVATQRPLIELVQEGRFRQDLFYRLNVVTLRCPPLREHCEDIPELVTAFAAAKQATATRPKRFAKETIAKFKHYSWPGNVRELENIIEHALNMCPKEVIDAADICFCTPATDADPFQSLYELNYNEARMQILDRFRSAYVRALLRRNNGHIAQAAKEADIPRPSLHRMIKECGIDPNALL